MKIDTDFINFAVNIIQSNKNRSQKIAITDGNESITYAQLESRIKQIACRLNKIKVTPGQTCVISMDDCVDWPAVFLGCIYAGAVPVPVYKDTPNIIFQNICRFVDCKVIFTDNSTVSHFQNLQVVDKSMLNQWYLKPLKELDPVMSHPDSAGYMGLSSGSTGIPKIAVVRHQALFDIVKLVPQALYEMDENSIMLSVPKMCWGYGLHNTITYSLGIGATAVVIPGPPSPTKIFQCAQKHLPTIIATTPTVIKKLLGPASKKYSLPNSVKRIQSSGESIPETIFDNFKQRFGLTICTSIGQLEVANTHYASTSGKPEQKGTVGKPLPGVKIKIKDHNDQDCPVGQPGEIWVNSQIMASHYHNNYTATKQTFFGPWIKTGDFGLIDCNGNLVFVGRANDVFKINEFLVSPVDVESQILKNNNVEDVAIVGQVNEKQNTEMHAFLIVKASFDLDSFKVFLQDNFLKHQVPKHLHMVETLPTTVTGKKDRKSLLSLLC